jgi:hypothetical protein
MPTEPSRRDDDLPDASEFWRWAWHSVRAHAGWIFIVVGMLLVLLGYLGVSRESVVAKQVPYIVSGGIGGIVAAVFGAYLLATNELRRDSGRLDRLEAMVTDLHGALLRRTDTPATDAASDNGRDSSSLLALPSGESYHRAGCPMLDNKSATTVTPAAVKKRNLRPCPLCEPVLAEA